MDQATRLILEDILANARLAVEFSAEADESMFAGDIGLVYKVCHAISLIGEAASKAAPSDRKAIASLPWRA